MSSLWDEGLSQFLAQLRDSGVDNATIDGFLKDKASPEDTKRSCLSLQTDTGKKYGQLEVAGQKVPGKWVQMIMDNINRFVMITDYAMKGAPETVGLAWWGIKQVLNAVQNNYKLYGFFGAALGDITEMMVVIRTYDKLYDERGKSSWKASDMVNELFKHIRDVYQAILDFSYSVKKHLGAGKVAKLGHAIKDALGTSSGEFQDKMSTIKGLKAKILEAANAAFQNKTFIKFDEVQEALNVVVDGQETSLKVQLAIKDSIDELAKGTKPKSREDWAKQEFDKHKKNLNPLPDSTTTFEHYRKLMQNGTCEWVSKNPEYEAWRTSTKSTMLCVDGDHGVGKSVLLASITNQLETELAGDEEWALQYLSCETLQNSTGSDARNDSRLSSVRVQNTLIHNLYEYANKVDKGDVTVLERCNAVFQNPKQKKNNTTMMEKQKAEDLLPDLDEAFEGLAQILGKKNFVIIDAVELIVDADEEEFVQDLQDLINRSKLDMRVLVSCFSGSQFYTSIEKRGTPIIHMSDHNRADIELVVKTNLKHLPGWSEAEQEEAYQAIIDKTGSNFKYALQVAMPFLKEPWQRPLSNRLKQLPGGLEETYSQAIGQMAPNYRALLKTSVTWALLADGPITVTEVMDAHLGTYLNGAAPVEDPGVHQESFLYREQIRRAGGPFLDCQKTDQQSIVKLKDQAAVRRFFLREAEDDDSNLKEDAHLCDNCRNKIITSQDLVVSEKHDHLALAIILVKHLNSPSFQSVYFADALGHMGVQVKVGEAEVAVEESSTAANGISTTEAKPGQDSTEANGTVSDASKESQPLTEESLAEHNAAESAGTLAGKSEDDKASGSGSISEGEKKEGTGDDESQDSADRSVGWDQESVYSGWDGQDNSTTTRYEIRHWFDHVKKAEEFWPNKAEREKSEAWRTLLEEMDKFVNNEPIFAAWMKQQYFYAEGWTPLHIAAQFGLLSLADYLISKGAALMVKSDDGLTPLHCAANHLHSDMLKLLLERGADPNLQFGYEMFPAFYYWLQVKAKGSDIQVFLDHGASCNMKDEWGFNSLHFYAGFGSKPEELFLLLDHVDEKGEKVNINEEDKGGETPLHKLMSRRDIPLDLLRAFIDRGADVNKDDSDSKRPLYQAGWQGELEAMKIIIQNVTDIDDDDKRGRTVMHDAAWRGHTDVLRFLLENKASITRTDHHDRTPLFFACLGKSEETVQLLLDKMIEQGLSMGDINKKTLRGRTPLRQAASKGFTSVVQTLLDKIDDLDIVNVVDSRKGRNALHCAAYRGKCAVVAALLKKGVDSTTKDANDKIALQICHEEWAIQETQDFEDTVSLLIKHDPAAAAKDSLLMTTAAVIGSRRILEELHKAEADLDKIDRYGWTPLLLARQYRNNDAEEFLSRQTMPTRWECKVETVTVGENGRRLEHPGDLRLSVMANRPVSSELTKYYYEITILTPEEENFLPNPIVAVGFCTRSDPDLLKFPGWPMESAPSSKSWAYHGDDGGLFNYTGFHAQNSAEQYGPGDTIGCGVDFGTGKIWYTKNGKMIEKGFERVMGRLFPVVGLKDKAILVANFGGDLDSRPFVWKENEEVK